VHRHLIRPITIVNRNKQFILDDNQYEVNRSSSGELVGNKARFPQGIVNWTNEAKSYGVTISPYSSNGLKTCSGYPGSYGYELQDLETWRSWGWSYMLKYDNCNFPSDNITQQNEYGRYARMQDAIDQLAAKYNETPFIYSLCQWGWENPQNWAPRISQAWRIDNDIKPYWSSIATVLKQASESYLATGSVVDANEEIFQVDCSSFYQHGDMDMLEVGNNGRGTPKGNLTYDEQKVIVTFA
jgi:alpha-galactosidase